MPGLSARVARQLADVCTTVCAAKSGRAAKPISWLRRLKGRVLDRLLTAAHSRLSLHERVDLLSRLFMRTPYLLDALGEGPKGRVDRDPTFRLDRVDCMTYVESVLGLARARTLAQGREVTQQVRYRAGEQRYASRHHFTAAQWIPQNAARGFVEPITRAVGGSVTRTLHKRTGAAFWRRTRWPRRLGVSALPREVRIDYIPLDQIERVARRLPAVSIAVEVWRSPHAPTVVRHIGLLVVREGKVYYRHAARSRGVVEDSLRRRVLHRRWVNRWLVRRGSRRRMVGFSIVGVRAAAPSRYAGRSPVSAAAQP